MVLATDSARAQGYAVVTFTGFADDNPLKMQGDFNLWVESRAYDIVEMTHQIWLLAVCDFLIGKKVQPDGTMRKLLDVSRLHALGWRQKIGLREGIGLTCSWYVKDFTETHSLVSPPSAPS